MSHQLEYHQGLPVKKDEQPRPYWYCSCTRHEGPGWVLYQTQPRGGGKPKPDQEEAERLHRRHVKDLAIPEEAWW
jgi:hypothetical protein